MAHPQANCGDKPLGEYFFPTLAHVGSPVLIPNFQANQWEIRPSMIQMMMKNSFIGEQNPYTHLTLFIELCATFKLLDVPQEVIYLKLFPFSLMGRAKEWLYSHEPNTFTSWDGLANAFLLHFFPPAITKKLKQQIRTFEQYEEESFHETFARFNELLHACPHHNLHKWDLLEIFYDGLTPNAKSHLDSLSGGTFMDLKVEEGYKKIEKVARNSYLWGDAKVCRGENQEETPRREKEVSLVYEDKPFESSYDMTNQASKDNFYYEEDEDIIPQLEEVSLGKEFEVEVDSQPLLSNPWYEPLEFLTSLANFDSSSSHDSCASLMNFDESLMNIDAMHNANRNDGRMELGCSLDESCDNELEGFEWPLDELFDCEDFTLHDDALFDDVDESCDDEPIGFVWPIDDLFEYEDSTLFDDVELDDNSLDSNLVDNANDLFDVLMSIDKQGKDLIFVLEAIEEESLEGPLFITPSKDKIIRFIKRCVKRRIHILLAPNGINSLIIWSFLRNVHLWLDGRKFKWDLKVD